MENKTAMIITFFVLWIAFMAISVTGSMTNNQLRQTVSRQQTTITKQSRQLTELRQDNEILNDDKIRAENEDKQDRALLEQSQALVKQLLLRVEAQ